MGTIYIIGLGPGTEKLLAPRAKEAIIDSDVLCGYTVYVDLVKEQYPDKEIITTPMKQEMKRCELALEAANEGKKVAMLCSGDAGIYGMAGPILEMLPSYENVEAEVIPGITAAISGAAVLGAPIMNDFCVISLSDLLTPWEMIERRLEGAAMGDFAVCLYNPMSKKRVDHLQRACDIFLKYRSSETICGWVRNIGRDGEEKKIMTLGELRDTEVDMFTTVFIGSSNTREIGEYMVTPRGYKLTK